MNASARLSTSSWPTSRHAWHRAPSEQQSSGPSRRPREQEAGDVRAGDEQHEANGGHHHEEHGFGRTADVAFREGLDADANEALVDVSVHGRQTLGDAVHLGLRLDAGEVGSESAEHVERAPVARLAGYRGIAGSQTSVLSGNRMPAGMTPTIVPGCPSTRMGVPTTSGLAP